jgi:two-component system chemotaxis sensor kinase CheA
MEPSRDPERLQRLHGGLDELAARLTALSPSPERDGLLELHATLEREAARLELVPLASLERKLGALTDELSRALGKRVGMDARGAAGLEVDAATRDLVQDLLVPALRNAVDHGIEAPDARGAAGKPETGRIEITFSLRGASLLVELRDDGRGLDVAGRLRAAGREGDAAPASDAELNELFFSGRGSTRAEPTLVSGRGIGLAGVRAAARARGGDARLRSRAGEGTGLELNLPLVQVIAEARLVATPDGDRAWLSGEAGRHEARPVLFRAVERTAAVSAGAALRAALLGAGSLGVLAARALPTGTTLAPLLDPAEFVARYGQAPT